METSAAPPTARVVVLVIDPMVAVIVTLPAETPVARPVAEMLTMPGVEEFHETEFVRLSVLPSEKVPTATNCCIVPSEIEIPEGLRDSDINTGELTWNG